MDNENDDLREYFAKVLGTGLPQEIVRRVAFSLFGKPGKTVEWLRGIRSSDPYTYGRVLGMNWAIRASLEQLTAVHQWLAGGTGFSANERGNHFARHVYLLLHPEQGNADPSELQTRLRSFWRDTVRAFDEDVAEDGSLEYWCLTGFSYGVDDAFAEFRKAAES